MIRRNSLVISEIICSYVDARASGYFDQHDYIKLRTFAFCVQEISGRSPRSIAKQIFIALKF